MMKLHAAIAALALCLVQALPGTGYGTIATPESDQKLKAMETKFFEHNFSREAEEYRLQRLEKFAFGQTGTGTVDQRLAKLVQVIDLHPNLVPAKTAPAEASQAKAQPAPRPAPQRSAYSRELDDPTPQSAHDKMKWVEEYRPRAPIKEPMASVVDPETRMSEEDRELAALEEHFAEKATKPLPSFTRVNPAIPSTVPHIPKELPSISAPLSQIAQQVDPSIYSDAPPDHHARMLTRVSWCEQHVFGHTFPQLHLTARLHQLNAELFPTSKVSDFELMDRLDLIVREVVMQQHPPIAYNQH